MTLFWSGPMDPVEDARSGAGRLFDFPDCFPYLVAQGRVGIERSLPDRTGVNSVVSKRRGSTATGKRERTWI